MTHSIFQTMQDIESEAKAVLDSYDTQIQDLQIEAQKELDSIAEECDRKREEDLQALKEELSQELSQLNERLVQTKADNDANVRSVLTDKKADLVQQIVDRVVEKYGN